MRFQRRDEAGRQIVLRRTHRDTRSERRDGLVADELVDDVRRLPQRRHVDVALEAEAGERLGERLARGALAVDAHRQAGRLAQTADELARAMRLQRAGRIVEQYARGTEVRELSRLLHERIGLAGPSRAVDEAGLELAAGRSDGVGGLAQVRDVVERIVETENVDAVRGRRGDEAADEVLVNRTRADEETPAQGEAERRLHARLERADPLPRALDTAADGALEAAAARDLEIGEAGPIEDLGDAQLLSGGEPARERLLSEQPDGCVRQARHAWSLAPRRRPGGAVWRRAGFARTS